MISGSNRIGTVELNRCGVPMTSRPVLFIEGEGRGCNVEASRLAVAITAPDVCETSTIPEISELSKQASWVLVHKNMFVIAQMRLQSRLPTGILSWFVTPLFEKYSGGGI